MKYPAKKFPTLSQKIDELFEGEGCGKSAKLQAILKEMAHLIEEVRGQNKNLITLVNGLMGKEKE